ncbi:MAG: multidrug effflux MFS transporter [Saccharospirillum sp.]|nr:multidrug effflux MFS transporter [Saccharospirillum sp.]
MTQRFQFALLMAMTMALGPLAIDAYLPAFPVMASDLSVTEGGIALTLSLYVFGLAIGQLIGGPLSDRLGRSPVLLIGLGIYFLSCIAIAYSPDLRWMIIWRLIQAFGGGWIAVSVPALVRDTAQGQEAARLFTLIALIMFIAPALAPALGSILLLFWEWPSIFFFLAAYAGVLTLLLWHKLLKSLPKKPGKREPISNLLTNYGSVLKHPVAWKHIAIQAMGFSVIMLFVTHASFMYQSWFGLNNGQFSAAFASGVFLMGLVGTLNRRLLLSYATVSLLKLALAVQVTALVIMNILLAFNSEWLWSFLPMMIVVGGTIGAIAPNNQAAYLEYFSQLSGTASAMLGAMQFIIAGTIASLSTIYVDGNITRITLTMLTVSALALSSALLIPSRPAQEAETG